MSVFRIDYNARIDGVGSLQADEQLDSFTSHQSEDLVNNLVNEVTVLKHSTRRVA